MLSLSLPQESLSSMSWAPGVGTTLGGSLTPDTCKLNPHLPTTLTHTYTHTYTHTDINRSDISSVVFLSVYHCDHHIHPSQVASQENTRLPKSVAFVERKLVGRKSVLPRTSRASTYPTLVRVGGSNRPETGSWTN